MIHRHLLSLIKKIENMGIIRVRDIRLHTNHGCLPEEGKIGSEYIVHVEVEADLTTSEQTDNLKDTVDYVHIFNIVKKHMQQRARLLETVVKKINDEIMKSFPEVVRAEVEVCKINPPIGGDVGHVSVTGKAERTLVQKD